MAQKNQQLNKPEAESKAKAKTPAKAPVKAQVKVPAKAALKTASAHTVGIRMSPRKMRLVTNMVKGMPALDAMQQLRFTNKKASKYVLDLIRSAIANADHNFKLDVDRLYIKTITCDMGPKLKRYMPRAQGRASEIRRPSSHIHIILEERPSSKASKSKLQPSVSKQKTLVKEASAVAPEDVETEQGKGEKKITMKTAGGKPSQTDTSTEQRSKQAKATQKRRLFNRKSGV
jgi:large subunit ribosomal protein L22